MILIHDIFCPSAVFRVFSPISAIARGYNSSSGLLMPFHRPAIAS